MHTRVIFLGIVALILAVACAAPTDLEDWATVNHVIDSLNQPCAPSSLEPNQPVPSLHYFRMTLPHILFLKLDIFGLDKVDLTYSLWLQAIYINPHSKPKWDDGKKAREMDFDFPEDLLGKRMRVGNLKGNWLCPEKFNLANGQLKAEQVLATMRATGYGRIKSPPTTWSGGVHQQAPTASGGGPTIGHSGDARTQRAPEVFQPGSDLEAKPN